MLTPPFPLAVYLVLIYFLFVETRGLSLEEVALLFDNEATSLAGKKEAADAQVKFNNKQKEIEHVERKLSKDESV